MAGSSSQLCVQPFQELPGCFPQQRHNFALQGARGCSLLSECKSHTSSLEAVPAPLAATHTSPYLTAPACVLPSAPAP